MNNKVTFGMYKDIQKVFTAYEVRKVVSNMKWSSYRGPDELPAHFYHHNWDTLGKDIMNHTLNILNNKGDCSHINQTYIFLIPKKTNPQVHSDYRPMSLCNTILKMVTNTLANRIKSFLDRIIDPNQSDFIPNKLITDNIHLAYKLLHSLNKNKSRNKGYVGLNLDMDKAYDRIE